MSNFKDISMQWLHFVNELHCYKGKENKKQLLNITQVLCSHTIVTLKEYKLINQKHYCYVDYVLYWVGVGSAGGPIKNQSHMSENYLQNKKFTWVFGFFLFRSSYKIFKKNVLGVQQTPPPVKKGLKRDCSTGVFL